MPFTFAHPAIILPLYHKPRLFSFTGLIVGSMSPDFEYFIRMKIQSLYSHELVGVLAFDIPISLAVIFLFHNVIRNRLIINLPAFFYYRFVNDLTFNWNSYFRRRWFTVIYSILFGALTHLLWDSFTHSTGYFVERWHWLQGAVTIVGTEIPIIKLLQHSSSLLGLVLITLFVLRLSTASAKKNRISGSYWLNAVIITMIIFAIRGWAVSTQFHLGDGIVSMISSAFIGLTLASLIADYADRSKKGVANILPNSD